MRAAPGRVDLMGSHTDYNEGCVLTLPIDRDTWIIASPRQDDQVQLVSLNVDSTCEFCLDSTPPKTVEGWGRYVQGVALVLQEAGYPVHGFQGIVHGTVPISSGLSSSASLEAAVATLMERLGGFSLGGVEKAKLCQQAENNWVGVNCGILDQYSSILGEEGEALLLDCRTLTHEYAEIPCDLNAVICNTCAPRQLSGSEYGDRRSQCESGAAFFAKQDPGIKTLRDVPLSLFERHQQQLPQDVRRRSHFIIEENARVFEMADALRANDRAAILRITADSFAGARDLFEISVPAMQAMFDAMDAAPGRVGCRQAGAGFGGCMIALVEAEQVDAFCESVTENYRQATGIQPEVYAIQTAAGAGPLELAG